MRALLIAATIIVSLSGAAAFADGVTFGTPRLLGEFVLPTGLSVGGMEFGGISGLDYDAKNDLYYAISDDKSQHGPARFYTLKLRIDDKGVHGVDIVSTVPLKNADGQPFPVKGIDPESIRYDAATGHIFWSSEGDAQDRPGIYEATTDGTMLRQFKLPDYFMPGADGKIGTIHDTSLESLSISADGKSLFAGLENGLAQDGGRTTLTGGSLSRIVRFNVATGLVDAEYPIEIGPIPIKSTKPPFFNDNGMSEFMLLNDDTLLTLERSFALGVGNEIDLYVAGFAGATNVSGRAVIKGTDFTAATKQKVLKIGEGDFGLDIDNVECLTFGPLVDGKPTVVLASDNNFNPDGQFTQFVVFSLDGYKAQ